MSKKTKTKLPSTLLPPLRSDKTIVTWISEVTKQPESQVLSRLHKEYENLGSNVKCAFSDAGLELYEWSSGLGHFYEQTDAFLYELAIWNCNKIKRKMRRWIAEYLETNSQRNLNILSIGDGLGFDSMYLAQLGHNITYFEVSGYTEAFARKVFSQCEENITVITDQDKIPSNKYDIVICLDVLEHVPDLHSYVETITGYIRPGGELIVHAPFYMIHHSNPTHLKSNRKYSGNLSLYTKHNLKLIDGELGWNPLVFEKREESLTPRRRNILKLIAIRFGGLYLTLGRFSILPFWWIDSYRRKRSKWFGN